MFACIVMVVVVVHEVMLCSFMVTHGNWMMIDMMFIYCYDYVYTCIMLIWFILHTRYPPLNHTEVC